MFSSPYLALILTLYGAGLALLLFELFTRKTGYILPMISLLFFIAGSIVGLLTGASLFEVALVATMFLVVSLFGIGRKAK